MNSPGVDHRSLRLGLWNPGTREWVFFVCGFFFGHLQIRRKGNLVFSSFSPTASPTALAISPDPSSEIRRKPRGEGTHLSLQGTERGRKGHLAVLEIEE